MKRINLLVEGQTEETFVRELLAPHYARQSLFINPIIVSTSKGYKGGVTSYGKVKHQLSLLCKQDRDASVSTLLDLYGLPGDFPGKKHVNFPTNGTGEQKAEFLEAKLNEGINEPNFIPYLMVHEFEALLFVKPEAFGDWTDNQHIVNALEVIANSHENPEHINDSPQTAPSKRILKLMPGYKKTLHGPLITMDIGLDSLRRACPHFNNWLLRLEQVAAQ